MKVYPRKKQKIEKKVEKCYKKRSSIHMFRERCHFSSHISRILFADETIRYLFTLGL